MNQLRPNEAAPYRSWSRACICRGCFGGCAAFRSPRRVDDARAMIRLTNNSRTTIRYLADYDGSSSAGSLLFRVQKMSNGWTTASTPIKSMLFPDPRTGMTNEYFFSAENVKPGESLRTFLTRDLKPGRSAEFWVWLEPGASPIRVGTICLVPQSKLAARWQPWLARIKGWCGIKATVPGQIEVWCPTSLHTPSPVQPAVAD